MGNQRYLTRRPYTYIDHVGHPEVVPYWQIAIPSAGPVIVGPSKVMSAFDLLVYVYNL